MEYDDDDDREWRFEKNMKEAVVTDFNIPVLYQNWIFGNEKYHKIHQLL
jgi:hypothetical protein